MIDLLAHITPPDTPVALARGVRRIRGGRGGDVRLCGPQVEVDLTVAVAQLVRAPDCGSGGRGFESLQPPFAPPAGNGLPAGGSLFGDDRPPMSDLDQLGSFYLGREHDLKTGETDPAKPLLYDSKDLTTHAVCVGMTGSGKTGLCLSLLEEAALDGIPAIAIDPKGDLGNLLLTFPKFEPSDFRPWIETSEAARQADVARRVRRRARPSCGGRDWPSGTRGRSGSRSSSTRSSG